MHSKLEPLPPKSRRIIQPESFSRKPSYSSSQSCASSEAMVDQPRTKDRVLGELVMFNNCQNLAEGDNYATKKEALPPCQTSEWC